MPAILRKNPLWASCFFTSAFLFFVMQPLLAKALLPGFGGARSVWLLCLFFFQSLLLAGYLFAFVLSKVSSVKTQILLYAVLLILSLCFLPLSLQIRATAQAENPTFFLLRTLSASVVLPGILISACSPLFQYWFSLRTSESPYVFYSYSNAGSLLALLSYPFFIETLWDIEEQLHLWTVLYGAYILLNAVVLLFLYRSAVPDERKPEIETRSPRGQTASWFFLSFAGSLALLSISDRITLDIAPFPLLWVLPLAIYLCTFIVCFSMETLFQSTIARLLEALAFLVFALCLSYSDELTIPLQVAGFCFALAFYCLTVHGELVFRKPGTEHLTAFYLAIAVGGASGGLFLNIISPLWLSKYTELCASAAIVFFVYAFSLNRQVSARTVSPFLLGFRIITAAGFILFALSLLKTHQSLQKKVIFSARNFYGELSVHEKIRPQGGRFRVLRNGSTEHGAQLLDVGREKLPILYYARESGIGKLFDALRATRTPKEGLNIGAVGLGVGSVSAYLNEGDRMRYYEINPMVQSVAMNFFSYLKMSPTSEDVRIGDARLLLASELRETGSNQFDVLILDAFNSDSIPTHLLTVEAFALYWSHLKKNGTIAVLLDSDNIDLTPLMIGLAQTFEKEVRFVDSVDEPSTLVSEVTWAVIGSDIPKLKALQRDEGATERLPEPLLWTDKHSDVWSILRW